MKLNLSKSNWPRLAFQWGVILYVAVLVIIQFFTSYVPDFEAYCPFGGLQALGSYFINNSLTCSMTSAQIVMGIAMMIGVFLFSKLFCSYICPVGTVTEWFSKLGDKLNVSINVPTILDKILRSLKYALLFITLYYTFDSSELFCKKFDPYYALATGFSMDVVALYAAIAIFLVIIGSVFIKMFWCKYICPFGAIANIFKFTVFFVLVMGIYIVLLKVGLDLSYVWPLTVICIGGYLIEISGFKTRFFPITKITRNEDSCTDCQLCSMSCPQSIDVANMKEVRDVDCNLCVECVVACPESNTLQVNKKDKFKWLPPIALIVLMSLGLYIGTFFEVPTIDQKWYDASEMKNAEIYTRSGLKSIKCYGSCTAFANQMHKVKGVMGVTAYVGTKTVKIFYDPKVLNETQLEEAIFTPMKTPIRTLAKDSKDLQIVSIKLDKFFDNFDFNYLCKLMQQKTKAVGVETVFGCPVIVNLYYPADIIINENELTGILESNKLTYKVKDGETTVNLNYVVIGDYTYNPISLDEYVKLMFKAYKAEFGRIKNYSDEVIGTYIVPMGKNKSQVKNLKYLASHLYNKDEVLGVRNFINDNLKQMLEIKFVDTLISPDNVLMLLNGDSLLVSYSSGKKAMVKNMFNFNKDKE